MTTSKPEYFYQQSDAKRFAKAHSNNYTTENGDIILDKCPYCGSKKSGGKSFAIHLKNGQYKCLDCGNSGDMTGLAQDFDFALSGWSADYYKKPVQTAAEEVKTYGLTENILRQADKYNLSDYIMYSGMRAKEDTVSNVIMIPYTDNTGITRAWQEYDITTGRYQQHKDKTDILYGMDAMDSDGRLVIAENPIDCMILRAAGIKNVVSIPNGTDNFSWIPKCWDWITESYEEIVVAGNPNGYSDFVSGIQKRLSTISILTISTRDIILNIQYMSESNKIDAVINAVDKAHIAPVAHITRAVDIASYNPDDVKKIKTHIKCIDKTLHGGIPMGGITLLTGKSGDGKSTLSTWFIASAIEQGHKCFLYSGEMTGGSAIASLYAQIAGAGKITTETDDYGNDHNNISQSNKNLINEFIGDSLYLYDNTQSSLESGNYSSDKITDTITKSIKMYGCDVIVVDNLMTAMAAEGVGGEDENTRQTRFMDKLREIAIQYNVCIILIAHKKKDGVKTTDDNWAVSGSANITNMASVVMTYESDKDLGTYERYLRISKNRLYGDRLDNTVMQYDSKSKRTYQKGEYSYEWDTFKWEFKI